MTTQGRDRLAGAVILLVAGAWCWGVIATIPDMGGGARVGPRGFPLALGVLLAALAALLIASSFFRPQHTEALEELKADSPPLGVELWAIGGTTAFLVGYAVLLWATGFIIATAAIVAAGLVLGLGKRNWGFVAAMSLGTALVVFVTFNKVLGVYLPHGAYVDLWF